MARPTKLTPEVGEKIIELLKRGNFRETACAAAGVHPKTLREWMRRGRDGEEPYAEFSERMDAAESAGEARHVRVIEEAGEKDWRASAFILARRWAARWQEQTTQHHDVSESTSPSQAAGLIREAFGDKALPKEKLDGPEGDVSPGSTE